MHALYEGVLFLHACFFGDCYYVMPLSSLNAATTSNTSFATQDLPEPLDEPLDVRNYICANYTYVISIVCRWMEKSL